MSIYICLVSVFSEENKNGVSSTLGMSWRHKWPDFFLFKSWTEQGFLFQGLQYALNAIDETANQDSAFTSFTWSVLCDWRPKAFI